MRKPLSIPRPVIALGAAAALSAGVFGASIASAPNADAHTHVIVRSCTALSVNLTNYPWPAHVQISGVVPAVDEYFGGNYVPKNPFPVAYTVKVHVKVTSPDHVGEFNADVPAPQNCAPVTTTTAPTTTTSTTAPATTTTAAPTTTSTAPATTTSTAPTTTGPSTSTTAGPTTSTTGPTTTVPPVTLPRVPDCSATTDGSIGQCVVIVGGNDEASTTTTTEVAVAGTSVLPTTGSSTVPLLAVGALALVSGTGAVVVARRGRR